MNGITDDCMVCGGNEYRLVCEKSGYKYVSCSECNTVRQYPYPGEVEIKQYYSDYQTRKSSDSIYLTDEGFSVYKRDKEFTFADLGLDALGGFDGKVMLDVGCGTGQFVKMMAEKGRTISGVDISSECIGIARAQGLDCAARDFLSVDGEYDVITMWHLIEHLHNPMQYLEHAYRLLAAGGWLLVETPRIGVVSTSFGADWRFYMPVEHINLFTQDTLFKKCTGIGFRVASWVSFGSGNDSQNVAQPNKRAMDLIAKKYGFGDTLATLFIK